MRRRATDTGQNGRFAYEGLDRLLHEKARLGILTSLLSHPQGLPFGDLKVLCSLTDGNLSCHLQVLEAEGMLQVDKHFEGRKPRTLCRLTKTGRERFLSYLSVLEKVLQDAALSVKRESEHERTANAIQAWNRA